jgi:hypothetical protein
MGIRWVEYARSGQKCCISAVQILESAGSTRTTTTSSSPHDYRRTAKLDFSAAC